MLNERFDFNGNFFTSSSSPKIFGLRPKSKSRPKIWIYPYYSLPLPGLILLHNSKVFKLLNNYPPPVVRFVEVFYARPTVLFKLERLWSLMQNKGVTLQDFEKRALFVSKEPRNWAINQLKFHVIKHNVEFVVSGNSPK